MVGGTPAYRKEFIRSDTPTGADDFDAWVIRTVLNPETPLFREGRYLLAEEPDKRDGALHHSVPAAVAASTTTRGGTPNSVARKATDLAPPIHVLNRARPELGGVAPGGAGGGTPLLAIGEAKWGDVLGTRHLERPRRNHALLADHGKDDTSSTALV